MSNRLKTFFLILMTAALGCGFMHHANITTQYDFERLHIFLFNLCVGGSIVIYYTEGKKQLSKNGILFVIASLIFAFSAFFEFYFISIYVPLFLAFLVERVRVAKFGYCLPKEMFGIQVPISEKFHQASLLCLTFGLIFSSPVILNEVYLHLVDIPKLSLNTFFLGFSFPLSLITMSVIFSLMQPAEDKTMKILHEISFWVINLGVIIFFFFILLELFIPQVLISCLLFLAVCLIIYIYMNFGIKIQEKMFLVSGLLFLFSTAISGIVYIFLEFSTSYDPFKALPLLRLHAFTALYGWNLSGLAVIARYKQFPLRFHSPLIISIHWLTVLVLCPIGYFYAPVAILAIIGYIFLGFNIFFKKEA